MEIKGIEIKEFREKHNLSQEEFAELIGVALRTVQNYEAEGVIPKTKFKLLRFVFNTYNKSTGRNSLSDFPTLEIIEFLIDNKEEFRKYPDYKQFLKREFMEEEYKPELESKIEELTKKVEELYKSRVKNGG